MPKIIISADSTCDLPQEIRTKYGISVIPMYISLNGKSYRDSVNLMPDDIYKNYEKTGTLPKTAAIPPSDFIDYFSELKKNCDEIIHFSISSEFSSVHNNASVVASNMKGIYCVDSRNLSAGVGILAFCAAIMAEQGMSAQQIVSEVEGMVPKVDTSFVIDTLEYLHKGGRCSSVALLGANLLNIKPCIEVIGGKMDVGKKYRGKLGKVLSNYIEDRLAKGNVNERHAFIIHSGLDDDTILPSLVEQVKRHGLFDEIYTGRAGCTVTSHCGPNTLGIIFMHK